MLLLTELLDTGVLLGTDDDERLVDAGVLLAVEDEPPIMPKGAGCAAQVAAAIQLLLFSQPQPFVVVTQIGQVPCPYQLHCWPPELGADELATELAGVLEAGVDEREEGALLDTAADDAVPLAL